MTCARLGSVFVSLRTAAAPAENENSGGVLGHVGEQKPKQNELANESARRERARCSTARSQFDSANESRDEGDDENRSVATFSFLPELFPLISAL